jgi:hypothetical protein
MLPAMNKILVESIQAGSETLCSKLISSIWNKEELPE